MRWGSPQGVGAHVASGSWLPPSQKIYWFSCHQESGLLGGSKCSLVSKKHKQNTFPEDQWKETKEKEQEILKNLAV